MINAYKDCTVAEIAYKTRFRFLVPLLAAIIVGFPMWNILMLYAVVDMFYLKLIVLLGSVVLFLYFTLLNLIPRKRVMFVLREESRNRDNAFWYRKSCEALAITLSEKKVEWGHCKNLKITMFIIA